MIDRRTAQPGFPQSIEQRISAAQLCDDGSSKRGTHKHDEHEKTTARVAGAVV